MSAAPRGAGTSDANTRAAHALIGFLVFAANNSANAMDTCFTNMRRQPRARSPLPPTTPNHQPKCDLWQNIKNLKRIIQIETSAKTLLSDRCGELTLKPPPHIFITCPQPTTVASSTSKPRTLFRNDICEGRRKR